VQPGTIYFQFFQFSQQMAFADAMNGLNHVAKKPNLKIIFPPLFAASRGQGTMLPSRG
jgi:hypothetical protein